MAAPSVTSSTVIPNLLCAVAPMFGVSLADVVDRHRVDPVRLADVDERVPSQLEMDLFDELAIRAGEPALGIRLAGMPSLSYDVNDYVARNSPDLLSAYRNSIRYQRLLHDGVGCEVVIERQAARLLHHPTPGLRMSRHAIECAMGLFVTRGRALTGVDWVPRAVSFRTAPPDDDKPYRELFRLEVAFAQPVTEVVIDRELLELPLPKADPSLFKILEQTAQERLARLHTTSGFSDEVRREVCRQLRGQVPRVADVARRVGVSARTLHHRLQREGVSFGQVVDQARLAVAQGFLSDPTVKSIDLALVLGFSDASAFHRAFRRWTGTTPREYQRSGSLGRAVQPHGSDEPG